MCSQICASASSPTLCPAATTWHAPPCPDLLSRQRPLPTSPKRSIRSPWCPAPQALPLQTSFLCFRPIICHLPPGLKKRTYLIAPTPTIITHPTRHSRLQRHPIAQPQHLFRQRLDLAARIAIGQVRSSFISLRRLGGDVAAELHNDACGLVAQTHGGVAGDESHAASVVKVHVGAADAL